MKSIARLTDRPGYRVIRSLARKLRQIRCHRLKERYRLQLPHEENLC